MARKWGYLLLKASFQDGVRVSLVGGTCMLLLKHSSAEISAEASGCPASAAEPLL